MKACTQFDSLLSAVLENETSPTEAKFVKTHLTSCSRCRRQRDEMEALLHGVRHLTPVQTSEGFTEEVLARTRGLQPADLDDPAVVIPISRRPVWVAPLAAAAALSVIIFGVANIPRGTVATPETAEILTSPETTRDPGSGDVESLGEIVAKTRLPEVASLGNQENTGQSLGMVQDIYVVDAYELREPTGGGQAILTPVSGTDTPITVTF